MKWNLCANNKDKWWYGRSSAKPKKQKKHRNTFVGDLAKTHTRKSQHLLGTPLSKDLGTVARAAHRKHRKRRPLRCGFTQERRHARHSLNTRERANANAHAKTSKVGGAHTRRASEKQKHRQTSPTSETTACLPQHAICFAFLALVWVRREKRCVVRCEWERPSPCPRPTLSTSLPRSL